MSCFHRNGDGYIDRDEFALIIRSTGESISEEEIDELMKDGDKNADGMLDFDGMWTYEDDKYKIIISMIFNEIWLYNVSRKLNIQLVLHMVYQFQE